METSTLRSNDYASVSFTMGSWFVNVHPKFTEMTVFVDTAPTTAELTASLNVRFTLRHLHVLNILFSDFSIY